MELYRGKIKRTGAWFVGAVVCIGEKAYGLVTEGLFPERPAYSRIAIGYGLRERNLFDDGTEAAKFGWEQALKRYEDNFNQWEELEPETVTRCCGKPDIAGNVLFEGDVIRNLEGDECFEICYGTHMAFDSTVMEEQESVGFFLVSDKYSEKGTALLGATETYAYLIGNIFDMPELKQPGEPAADNADQDTLMSAT